MVLKQLEVLALFQLQHKLQHLLAPQVLMFIISMRVKLVLLTPTQIGLMKVMPLIVAKTLMLKAIMMILPALERKTIYGLKAYQHLQVSGFCLFYVPVCDHAPGLTLTNI